MSALRQCARKTCTPDRSSSHFRARKAPDASRRVTCPRNRHGQSQPSRSRESDVVRSMRTINPACILIPARHTNCAIRSRAGVTSRGNRKINFRRKNRYASTQREFVTSCVIARRHVVSRADETIPDATMANKLCVRQRTKETSGYKSAPSGLLLQCGVRSGQHCCGRYVATKKKARSNKGMSNEQRALEIR